MKLEYWIRNKKTQQYYQRYDMEIDIEDILDGIRDNLSSPINCNMEDEYEFCDFNIKVDGWVV